MTAPRPGILLLAALAVVTTAYSAVVHAPFAWDDWTLIVSSPAVRTLSPAAHLAGSFWRDAGHSPYYRPLTTWLLALDWNASGGSAASFHVTNLLLHLAAVALVFAVALRHGATAPGAAVAAALFGSLPRLTESVCWISGRGDLLATAFMLAALLVRAGGPTPRRRWATAALLLASLLSKEVALAGVAAIVVLEVASLRPRTSIGLARALVPPAAAVATWAVLRARAVGLRPTAALDSGVHGLARVEAALAALGRYGFMAADPLRPRLQVAPPGSADVAAMGAGIVVALILVTASAFALRRGSAAIVPALLAAAAVAVILVLDVGPLGLTSSNSDRFLYVPAALLAILLARAAVPRWVAAAAVALVAAFALRTYARALEWTDEVALWTTTAAEAPWSAVAAHELATALDRAHRPDEALLAYRRAADLATGSARLASVKNVAATLADLERLDEASAELRGAMAAGPVTAADHFNLGVIEMKRSRFDEAEAELRAALALRSDFAAARGALAALPSLRQEWSALPAPSRDEPAAVLVRRALLEQRLGLPRRAAASWARVGRAGDASMDEALLACRALLLLGDFEGARPALERARTMGAPAEALRALEGALASRPVTARAAR